MHRLVLSISTLHRPEGLERILRSLASQERPEIDGRPLELSVVVVNNDPEDASPDAVARRVTSETGLPIEVLKEPRRGVAPPRNRGIGRAAEIAGAGGLVGFVDDDEETRPGWLREMLRVKIEHAAEIVTGPVVPRFETPPPQWILDGGFFDKPNHPTGTERPWAFTNNVVFDAELLDRLDVWFDEGFLRLSEDRHFFQRLARSGAKIVWAAEAVVVDSIPPTRATAGWLVRRLRTVGRCVAPLRRDVDGRFVATIATLAKSPVWIAIGIATVAVGTVRGRACRVWGRSWIAYGVGLAEGVFSSGLAGRPASSSD